MIQEYFLSKGRFYFFVQKFEQINHKIVSVSEVVINYNKAFDKYIFLLKCVDFILTSEFLIRLVFYD